MKRKVLISFLCIGLCASTILNGCGTKNTAADTTDNPATAGSSMSDSSTPDSQTGNSDTTSDTEAEPLSYPFEAFVSDTDRMIQEAVDQYNNEDHTPLAEPVKYNVLWLGFTHVTYEELDFQMTDFDREYLEAVALNFEKSVEKITDHNLDITVDLHFIDEPTVLTKQYDDDWLYLAKETVQPVIDQYTKGQEIDTVLTTVQTAGEENRTRNESKNGYGVNYVMLGLETNDMSSDMGYSTFDLTEPKEGTYPLEDPEVPSLYATAVAVHEWMHQLEYMKTLLDIEYPNTHAYNGPSSFPGYQQYVADENDYDYFEFYKLVLKGELPYTSEDTVKQVGMYPKMWPLVKRNILNPGCFTIQSADENGYLTGQADDPTLTLSDNACLWNIKYWGNGHFALSPAELPDKLIDLSNAWDNEDNSIGLWVYTGYIDAQSWYLTENSDGSYSVKTPYESGRLLTVNKGEGARLCTDGADGTQKWIIKPYTAQ